MSYYDNRGHSTRYSGITSGANSTQHNGNIYGSVTNNTSYGQQPAPYSGKRTGPTGRSVEDYTVGWICALPKPEWQASRLMLDEEHEGVPLSNAIYQYVFGKMGEHNVVMGCCPKTQMGKATASAVAAEMRTLFPQLRIGLLVGVGGGVWSKKHDVRLGDVVVSVPDTEQRHGGVIGYDFGKSKEHVNLRNDGEGEPQGEPDVEVEFQPTGSINQPPDSMLSAIGKLESARASDIKFRTYFEPFDEDHPEFALRPHEPDRLFKTGYVHAKDQDGEPEETCYECSEKDEVKRLKRPRERSEVHFGTIASGDQVIKSSKLRDKLAKQYKGILCFEMEAAGLANRFPCLVVRGICDYCDSHKNKAWQPYAAAAAAAWGKELLKNIPLKRCAQRKSSVCESSGHRVSDEELS